MTTNAAEEDFSVNEAGLGDVHSLSTIVARAFHPVNPFIKNVFPDTARIREWWSAVFTEEISSSPGTCHVLKVVRNSDPRTVIGVLTLRLMGTDDRGSGFYTGQPLTADHDTVAYGPMIDGMSAHRERLMLGTTHFLIELLGVDHAFKGRQLGRMLLSTACAIADAAGYPTFVQANGSAKDFYCKLGFECKDKNVMPGEIEYVEYMLIRPYTK